jgi:nitroimidazol reductase NimA-like FMN-containing flavoprotein (pyridoxamine 5'-phosphate oxidase superfamily)
MTAAEPSVDQVALDIQELLREQEIGALAVLDEGGHPLTCWMHFAADRFRVYLHLFEHSRTHEALGRDARVSYTLAAIPPEGYSGRGDLRSIQVRARAAPAEWPEEVQRAVDVSREQFPWMQETRMLDAFARTPTPAGRSFYRLDPLDALWTDNRVRMLWRRLITFDDDGTSISDVRPPT